MIPARALSLLTAWAATALTAAAGPLDFDAGLRASIYDENYRLGVGAELGLIQNLGPKFDLGLHLNYSHFSAKTTGWDDTQEMGGYVTAYLIPTLADQPFELRLGPHAGGALLREAWHADLGGDAMAVFTVADNMRFYGAFIPSYFLGDHGGGMIRLGFGIEYRLSGEKVPAQPAGDAGGSAP
jgi:hypothetical protein